MTECVQKHCITPLNGQSAMFMEQSVLLLFTINNVNHIMCLCTKYDLHHKLSVKFGFEKFTLLVFSVKV